MTDAPVPTHALYPSRQLLPVPAFTFQIPDGWTVREFPQALAIVGPAEPVDGFTVNCLIATRRVSITASLARIAVSAVARMKRDNPDLRVELEKTGRFGDLHTYLRAVSLTAGEPERRIAQLHAFFFPPAIAGRSVNDLFTVIGTCPDELAREFMPSFLQIVATFDFVPMPPEFVVRADG